jgi:hypothetical protein
MVRRRWMMGLLIAGLTLCIVGPVFAQFEDISLSVSAATLNGGGNGVAAGKAHHVFMDKLRLKPGMELGKAYGAHNGTKIYPLANLDIYAQADSPDHAKTGVQTWFQNYSQGDITVIVPLKVINDLYKKMGKTTDAKARNLYYYEPKTKTWIPLAGLKKVAPLADGTDGYLYFKVTDWPTDDRVIGCD